MDQAKHSGESFEGRALAEQLRQARAEQAAVAKLLKIVAKTRDDPQAALDAIVAYGRELFDGLTLSNIRRIQGDESVTVATTRSVLESFPVGAPEWHEQHPRLAAELAIELRDCFRAELATGLAPLNVKLGLHTGLLTIGVAGNERLVLGLWGDAVATADAIAASAPLGQVRLSNATSSRLGSGFVADDPLIVEVPGRGSVPTRALKQDQSASTGTRG